MKFNERHNNILGDSADALYVLSEIKKKLRMEMVQYLFYRIEG